MPGRCRGLIVLRVHGWRVGLVRVRVLAVLHRAEKQHRNDEAE